MSSSAVWVDQTTGRVYTLHVKEDGGVWWGLGPCDCRECEVAAAIGEHPANPHPPKVRREERK